jgi:hypothetical protein
MVIGGVKNFVISSTGDDGGLTKQFVLSLTDPIRGRNQIAMTINGCT